MKKFAVFLLMIMPTLNVFAENSPPTDVQKFVDRREGCDHMRGEMPDPSEKRSMKDLNQEIQQLCKGTDHDLARLKKKYASNPSIMARLNEFEVAIEPLPASSPRKRTRR